MSVAYSKLYVQLYSTELLRFNYTVVLTKILGISEETILIYKLLHKGSYQIRELVLLNKVNNICYGA